MKTLRQIQQLRKLHGMIKLESTGSPKEIARHMNVSERHIYHLLEQLREMEAPICYNRRTNTYFYSGSFDLLVNVSVQVIQGERVLSIYAGRKFSEYANRLQGSCSDPGYLSYVKTKLDVVG